LAASTGPWSNCDDREGTSVGSEGLDLVLEGEVARVHDHARLERVAEVYASKYGWPVTVRDGAFHAEGAPTAGPPPYEVYMVTSVVVFGSGTDDTFASRSPRWRFQP
jgi:hypothetical protein